MSTLETSGGDTSTTLRPFLTLEARTELSAALTWQNRLLDLQPTMERYRLCGFAYKRLAMAERVAGRSAHAGAALLDMLRPSAAGAMTA